MRRIAAGEVKIIARFQETHQTVSRISRKQMQHRSTQMSHSTDSVFVFEPIEIKRKHQLFTIMLPRFWIRSPVYCCMAV